MANTTIQLRKSGVSGNVPDSLDVGELALNYADGKLYYKNADDVITFISSGATTNSFATINANSSLIFATSNTDTLSIAAGNNITISACTSTKTITINAQDADIDQFARDTANGATTLAQSAYNYANTISGGSAVDNVARASAQSAYELANSAYDRANSSNVLVKSEVTSIVAGSQLAIDISYANTMYPGGIFTITQQLPVSLIVTNIWSSGSANKNAYINLESNLVNTQNITINLALSQTDFNIQSSDFIRIGSNTVTGANLISLGISGNGGSYIIPSSFFGSIIQTNSSSTVSANLSTSRGFANTNGTTLTNTQATRFAVNSLTGNWPAATVPYFNLNQSFSWSASVTGTVSSGNVTYSGASSGSLTTTGATSGSSGSLNSNSSYSISSSDYRGAGLNGAGTRTIPSTVSSNITPATIYYPLFYKVTGSSANPNFTTSDTYITSNYVLGQGANTTANESDYLWIAIPGSSSHEFAFTFLNTEVVATPAVTYTGQTISGQTYNVYGFTNYSAVTYIYTTS
jgi:hypothetical protein